MIRPQRALALAGLLAAAAGACQGCRRSRFPSRGDAASVVVVAPRNADELNAPLGDEGEPNNTVAAARLLPFGGDPLVAGVAGSLPGTGKTADVDVFKVVIPGLGLDGGETNAPADALAARRLIVDVRPDEGLSLVLQLLDAAARPVVTTSAGPGERDGLPNIAVAPGGTYFLRLRADHPGKAGPDAGTGRAGYRLVVRVVDFEVGDEREPNDRAAQATELGGAHTNPEVAGFFGWRRDEDWYRLPVEGMPSGTVLDLELDGVEGVTAALALHDGAAVKVAAAHGRRGERVVLRNVALGPASAPAPAGRDGAAGGGRSVYVVVRTEGGRNLERRYTLHVRAGMAQEGSETEPNDDPAHASPLPDGLTTGFLAPGDTDVFRYTPSVPTALDLEVTPPERVNVKIEVLREGDGQPLASADEGGRRQPERLTNVVVTTPVLVRLTQRRGDGNADEPYQLRVTPHAAVEVPR
jgi:hypothetical protein